MNEHLLIVSSSHSILYNFLAMIFQWQRKDLNDGLIFQLLKGKGTFTLNEGDLNRTNYDHIYQTFLPNCHFVGHMQSTELFRYQTVGLFSLGHTVLGWLKFSNSREIDGNGYREAYSTAVSMNFKHMANGVKMLISILCSRTNVLRQ